MDEDEVRVMRRLGEYDLAASGFDKKEIGKTKTPDFRVSARGSDELRFFCEVKSDRSDDWHDRHPTSEAGDELGGDLGHDPIYNRLTKDIHQAVKQFDAVNPNLLFPNVLAFVNHDWMCGIEDLRRVLTGFVVTSDRERLPIF
jgi:hypothetical protein